MNEALMQWLTSENSSTFYSDSEKQQLLLIRVPKNEAFDYLYYLHVFSESPLKRGDSLKYAGLYQKANETVYDAQYPVRELLQGAGILVGDSAEALHTKLKDCVRSLVEVEIANDRQRLQVSELRDSQHEVRLRYYQQYTAASNARKAFLAGEDITDCCFSCRYDPDRWTEESLLEALCDWDGYAKREALAYMENTQEDMLLEFLENDALIAEYMKLQENPRHPVHCIQKIMEAVCASSAKTVNVTVSIDGTELTFKAEAGDFRRDCDSYYSAYHIAAADRSRFYAAFGRHADYRPEHILRITYGKQTLYEKL